MKERRSKNLIASKFQIHFALILAVPVFFSLITMSVGVLYWLISIESKNNFWTEVVKTEWINFAVIMAVCVLFLTIVHIFYVVKISQKVAGPMVAVERYLHSLKGHQGNKNLKLRDGDELAKLAQEIERYKKENPKFFQ